MASPLENVDGFTLYDMTGEMSSGDEKPSILYAMLPKLVRTRLRRLPSIRRSMSQYGFGTGSTSSSASSSRRSSRGYHDLPTPPPSYQSRLSLSLSEPVSDDDEALPPLRPLSSCSSSGGASPLDTTESGIKWRFANQGLSLLNLSAQEEVGRARRKNSASSLLARQLYVHGLTYLLRGLPADLSESEKMGIWSAVPVEVIPPAVSESSAGVLVKVGQSSGENVGAQEPSLLHRAVAAIIVQAFFIFQFLLPYVQYFAAVCYRYERRNRISERVLSGSIQTCEGMLNTSLRVTESVCKMNDGKVGQALNSAAVWWVTGVTGGIHQGVKEGLLQTGQDTAGRRRVESGKGKEL